MYRHAVAVLAVAVCLCYLIGLSWRPGFGFLHAFRLKSGRISWGGFVCVGLAVRRLGVITFSVSYTFNKGFSGVALLLLDFIYVYVSV